MARGKNAARTAARAAGLAASADERARAAEIEARRLAGVIADRDREIEQLHDALAKSRQEHMKVGTYTESDVARARSEERAAHVDSIRRGFAWIAEGNADLRMPTSRWSELAELLMCQAGDLLGGGGADRTIRRLTNREANLRSHVRELEMKNII